MAKPKILITRGWPAECEARAARDYDATLNRDDTPMNLDQMRAALAEHDAICPTVTDALPADLFGDDLRTRIIGNFGVGYNHIDIAAAKALGSRCRTPPAF